MRGCQPTLWLMALNMIVAVMATGQEADSQMTTIKAVDLRKNPYRITATYTHNYTFIPEEQQATTTMRNRKKQPYSDKDLYHHQYKQKEKQNQQAESDDEQEESLTADNPVLPIPDPTTIVAALPIKTNRLYSGKDLYQPKYDQQSTDSDESEEEPLYQDETEETLITDNAVLPDPVTATTPPMKTKRHSRLYSDIYIYHQKQPKHNQHSTESEEEPLTDDISALVIPHQQQPTITNQKSIQSPLKGILRVFDYTRSIKKQAPKKKVTFHKDTIERDERKGKGIAYTKSVHHRLEGS